jgi:hypothetical protein
MRNLSPLHLLTGTAILLFQTSPLRSSENQDGSVAKSGYRQFQTPLCGPRRAVSLLKMFNYQSALRRYRNPFRFRSIGICSNWRNERRPRLPGSRR